MIGSGRGGGGGFGSFPYRSSHQQGQDGPNQGRGLVAAEETGDVEEIGIDHDVTISILILHFKLSLMYHQNNGEYWWVNVPPR